MRQQSAHAIHFKLQMTDEDTNTEKMIAEMDLLQLSTPSRIQIEVLMVEPTELGQELDQSDADVGAKKHWIF